jgi:hypothetical protein
MTIVELFLIEENGRKACRMLFVRYGGINYNGAEGEQ